MKKSDISSEISKEVYGNKGVKKTVFTYICIFFFCILFILGVTSSFLYATAFDPDKYMERISSEEYNQTVLSTVYTAIEDMGDVITLGTDDIYNILDKESVVQYSYDYTKAYISSILAGKSFADSDIALYDLSYGKESLKKLVEEFYETSEESFSDEEFEIIYEYIQKQISGSLKFLPATILEKTNSALVYISKIKEVLSITRMALIPAILLLVGIILLNLKNISSLFYRTGAALFIPSAILFIPAVLFDRYNLGAKVVIARSPLSIVFSSIVDTVVKGFRTETFVFFLIASILIIAGASFAAFGKRSK